MNVFNKLSLVLFFSGFFVVSATVLANSTIGDDAVNAPVDLVETTAVLSAVKYTFICECGKKGFKTQHLISFFDGDIPQGDGPIGFAQDKCGEIYIDGKLSDLGCRLVVGL